jgi:NADP-dependent alcohol dehydrogenase
MIGHELTAFVRIMPELLAVVGPNLYRVMFETKKGKLAQYGKRIFNLTGTEDEIANEAINKTVEFSMWNGH